MSRTSIKEDLKRLAGSSAIYGIGSVLMRALTFLLLPLYTRFLTPADYGITGAASSVIAVLSIILPLGLHGAVTRYWFNSDNDEQRRESGGTLFLLLAGSALIMTLLLERFGSRPFSILFPDIPFNPYLRLAVWISFMNALSLVPLAFYQVRSRPLAYVTLTISSSLASILAVIWFVVIQRRGAYGYLLGMFVGGAIFVLPYLWVVKQHVRFVIQRSIAVSALAFSLPLIPHGFASWVLDLSDRAILAHYVPLADLGLYSVGYQVGAAMGFVVTAFTNAWAPYLYKTIGDHGAEAHSRVARLATYYAFVLCFIGLGAALFARPAIMLLTASSFHEAHIVTPWVVAGYVFNGLYIIPVGFLFWKERTKIIPIVTISAGVINVLLNLFLVPRFGFVAAAIVTCVSYALMLLFVWIAAQGVYPFKYDYARTGGAVLFGIALFLAAALIPAQSLFVNTVVRGLLWLAYPVALLALGVISQSERTALFTSLRLVRSTS